MAETEKFLGNERFSKDTQEGFKNKMALEGFKSLNKPEQETVISKEKKQKTELELLRFLEVYKDHEIPMAKRQRELLGLNQREFVILHGFQEISGIELDEKEIAEEKQKILASYKENAAPGMRLKEDFVGDTKTWLEFMGDIPLYDDRERMVNEYKKKEKDMKYGKVSISEKREELGMDEEKFLTAVGVLPKE